jgi:uncharacterized protein YecT (DUF1311 family)
MTKRIAGIIIIGLSLWAVAGTASAASLDCKDPVTDAEISECAAQDWQKADDTLNAVYSKALAKAAKDDADLAETSAELVGEVKALKHAQRAWIAYRDAECDLQGFGARGGTLEPVMVTNCWASMSRARTEDLKTFIGTP